MRFDTLELTIESKLEQVSTIDEVVSGAAIQLGFPEAAVGDIALATHEAVVNAIVHGGGGGNVGGGGDSGGGSGASVEVRIAAADGVMVVEVRDRGAGFDAAQVPSPLDEERRLEPSGRGIFTMRAYMDEVEYSARPGRGTIVRMIRRLPPPASSAASEETR